MSFVKQLDGSYIEASGISAKVVDDTKDFGVPIYGVPPPPPPACEDYYTESECIAAGCYWYNDACHRMSPDVVCSDYATESTCSDAGCYWYDGACHSKPKEAELPWIPIVIAVGGVIAAIGVFFVIKR